MSDLKEELLVILIVLIVTYFTVAEGSSDLRKLIQIMIIMWLIIRFDDSASTSNSSGTLTSTVVVQTLQLGFSICKYTGATGAQTFGHGLGAVPKVVIVKNLDSTGSGAEHWRVYHHRRGSSGKYSKIKSNNC